MIKPEQVPDEVWTQVALRLESAGAVVSDQVAKLVAADALNVWPGMLADGDLASGENGPPLHLVNVIILPLPPQENSDE